MENIIDFIGESFEIILFVAIGIIIAAAVIFLGFQDAQLYVGRFQPLL